MMVIVGALCIVPILPNKSIDPWQLFNPRNVALLMVTITAIQLGGFIVMHLLGERLGLAFTGFLGGLISSTIIFARLGDTLREHPKFILATLASAILATVAMLLDVIIIIFVASPTFLFAVVSPLLTMMLLGFLISVLLIYFQKIKKDQASPLSNPLSLPSILRTSLFLGFMLMSIGLARRYLSINSMLFISFFGGLVEIHGISLATPLLYLENQLQLNDAKLILYVAILASFISKLILTWLLTPRRFATHLSVLLIALLTTGVLTDYLS
jgi:uncharacterized membrane protein (DUF4010 family)